MSGENVVPIMMDFDDIDLDDGIEIEHVEEPSGLVHKLTSFAKSPIGMAVIALLVIIIIALGVLGSGALKAFGSPQLDNALNESQKGSDPVEDGKAEPTEHLEEASRIASFDERDYSNEYGHATFSDSGAMYHTASATVPLRPGPDAPGLTLSVGILADRETVKRLHADGLKVSLLKIDAVSSIDFGPYREWELPGLIASAVREQLESSFPDTEIRAVIIRDFKRF